MNEKIERLAEQLFIAAMAPKLRSLSAKDFEDEVFETANRAIEAAKIFDVNATIEHEMQQEKEAGEHK